MNSYNTIFAIKLWIKSPLTELPIVCVFSSVISFLFSLFIIYKYIGTKVLGARMRKIESGSSYGISKSKQQVLLYLHKYRFLTSDLLAEILSKDRSTIYERLYVLVRQGYIAKQYDSSFRLRGRPATYCLASAGIRYLKHKGIDRTQLHYKNKSLTEEQIDTQLLYTKIGIIIRKSYPDKFHIYTKYQLNPKDYILPTPHLLIAGKTDTIPDYLIEFFPAGTMSWRIRRRINQHNDAADESEYKYPNLLLIAGNINTEKRIIRMTADMYSDFEVFTTTLDRLMSGEKKVWLKPEEVDWDEAPECLSLPLKFVE